ANPLVAERAGVMLEALFEAGAAVVVHSGLDDLRAFAGDLAIALSARADDGDVPVLGLFLFVDGDHQLAVIGPSLGVGSGFDVVPALLLPLFRGEPVVLGVGQLRRGVLWRTEQVDTELLAGRGSKCATVGMRLAVGDRLIERLARFPF